MARVAGVSWVGRRWARAASVERMVRVNTGNLYSVRGSILARVARVTGVLLRNGRVTRACMWERGWAGKLRLPECQVGPGWSGLQGKQERDYLVKVPRVKFWGIYYVKASI